MTRQKVFSKKDSIEEIKTLQKEEKHEISLKNPPMLKNTGGSINNLPVSTDAYKKWLAEKQQRNSLVGSQYIEAAPEHGTEFELGETEEVEATEEMLDGSKAEMAYNPNDDTSTVVVDPEIENIKRDKSDNKYIDFCIVEATTKKLLGRSVEEIEIDANDEIKKYHNDENYFTEINVKNAIMHNEILLIENAKNDIKLIDKNQKNDDN